MYKVIAKMHKYKNKAAQTIEGTAIHIEPYWIAKTYKNKTSAIKFVKGQANNQTYYFEIEAVA
jgi:hypothetical protein